MAEKTKVLLFVDRLRVGGIQTLLVNLLEYFDQSRLQVDFLVLDDGETYDLEEKVRQLGATLYKLHGAWVYKPQDYITYRKKVKAFFKTHHDYDAVHMNGSSKNFYILYYAKKYGIPVRIAHSHNTGFQSKSKAQILLGNLFKMPLKRYANYYFACSSYAGEWLFGKKEVEAGKVHIMPNGIDLDRFCYSDAVRQQMRRELGVEDKIVIGNVGRFTPQKNHSVLIDIFAEIHRQNPDTVLLLAGIGELMEQTKAKVKAAGLTDAVQFLGFRTDVMNLTQAMDVFLMPSLYEGFPVTGIEAQAVGLPCVFSDTITREAKLIDQVAYVSLEESYTKWAEKVLALVGACDRNACQSTLKTHGFDIHDIARFLEEFYQHGDASIRHGK